MEGGGVRRRRRSERRHRRRREKQKRRRDERRDEPSAVAAERAKRREKHRDDGRREDPDATPRRLPLERGFVDVDVDVSSMFSNRASFFIRRRRGFVFLKHGFEDAVQRGRRQPVPRDAQRFLLARQRSERGRQVPRERPRPRKRNLAGALRAVARDAAIGMNSRTGVRNRRRRRGREERQKARCGGIFPVAF